jgi:hypothetical protein
MSRAAASLLAPAFLFIGGCGHHGQSHVQREALTPFKVPVPGSMPAAARQGAKLFAQLPCLNCHTYKKAGSANLNAPDLKAEGARHRGIQWQIRHLKCPECVVSGSPMPSFASLPARDLRKLAIFLEASK